jgi:hypothetical protein
MTWVAAVGLMLAAAAPDSGFSRLAVPLERQEPERCGPAALRMTMAYWEAGESALAEAERAYDPALRGSLITDLAAAARRGGFEADVRELTPDSLIALLAGGVPPIVLYQHGSWPLARGHFAVVVGWEPAAGRFVLHDGTSAPRSMRRDDLERRWRAAGSRALIVRPAAP